MKNWIRKGNKLQKAFEFENFNQAFSFMTQVAQLAEKSNHHPQWFNTWNKVNIILCTHDAGSTVTEKDIAFAKGIDRLI